MGFSPSTSVPDSEYLLTRSTTEARLAASARTEQAAAAHRKIVSSYLGRLFGPRGSTPSEADLIRPAAPMGDQPVPASPGARMRFDDVTSVPDNQELAQILCRLS